jgi:hypothetical protein
MPEKEDVFSSKIKYDGLINFSEFYKFCYNWLSEERGFTGLTETAYKEKIKGDSKEIDIEWKGKSKATDYFMFEIKVTFQVIGLKDVEIVKEGAKIKINKGSVETKIKGTLVRDYEGKFETSATKKFMRSVYEKWIIPSRVDEYEGKLVGTCDEFLSQAKAFLDLTGKR